jgi:hypothetical protein
MPSANVYVPINSSIWILVEEMKECLETQFLIQATQQDIIENAIVFLSTQSKYNQKIDYL